MPEEVSIKPQSLLPQKDQSSAVALDVWDKDLSQRGITQLTQPTKDKQFFFVRDAVGGLFKINFSTGYDPGVTPKGNVTESREPKQTFANIVRVTKEEMTEWSR